jgi:hypothetical protein
MGVYLLRAFRCSERLPCAKEAVSRQHPHFRNFDVRAAKWSVRGIPKIEDHERGGALPRLFLPK